MRRLPKGLRLVTLNGHTECVHINILLIIILGPTNNMRDDVLKIINRDQLVSCMNNTKWTQLINHLNDIECKKRVKYIDADTPSNWQSGAWMPANGYVEFSCGPVPLRFIEWLECACL